MKNPIYKLVLVLYVLLLSCQQEDSDQIVSATQDGISPDIISKLHAAGFDTSEGLMRYENAYLVEYDILLTEAQIDELIGRHQSNSKTEHYHTTNLVTGTPRTINVYMDPGFGAYMQNAFDAALARYNAENLALHFQRVSNSSSAHISILSFYEVSSVLGYSAGFPSGGNPASPIRLNTFYFNDTSHRGDATTVIAHEIGHAIGFRHTDYMNRAFSCGSGGDEGDGGVGAVHIPGTPTGPSSGSWMLACSNGSDRPFTSQDKTALNAVYPAPLAPPSSPDLYAIFKSITGTHSTEIHAMRGSDNFQSFFLRTGTALQETGDNYDFLIGDYNKDGKKDIYVLQKSITGTNSTELHILNGADNYQSFLLHTGTALHETHDDFDFVLGDYNKDGNEDVYAIKKTGTGTHSTEIHVLNGSNNFQNFLINTGTALHETPSNFDFGIGDYNKDGKEDIYAIKKAGTGTNSTEIHILNGSNNFQNFLINTGTALEETGDNVEFSVGDFNKDGNPDIYAVKRWNTATNSTEVHVLNGSNNFQTFLIETGTALGETDSRFRMIVK